VAGGAGDEDGLNETTVADALPT